MAKEGTQERCRKRKFIPLTNPAETVTARHEGPCAGSTKGTDSASLVGELRERPVGQAILLGSEEVPQAWGGFLVHVNVTRSQSGEGKRRTCGRGHTLTTWCSGPMGGVFTVCLWALRQQENTKFYKLLYSGPCGASTPMTLTRMDDPCHLGCGDVEGDRTAWFGPWRQALVKVTTRKSPDRHTMRFRAHLHFVGENQKPKSGSSGLENLWKIWKSWKTLAQTLLPSLGKSQEPVCFPWPGGPWGPWWV